MAYNIFSQPTGPQVSISLFGDAAKTGAELGKQIPNTITSIIQGGFEGVKLGQEIENQNNINKLNAVKAEHAEENMLLEQQINQERLKQMQVQNNLQTMQAQIDSATFDTRLTLAQVEKENQLAAANQQKEDTFVGIEINKQLSSPNLSDADKSRIFLDPKYTSYFSRNPEILKKGLSNYYGRGFYTGKEADAAEYLMFGAAERQYETNYMQAKLKAQTELSPLQKDMLAMEEKGNVLDAYNQVSSQNKGIGKVEFLANSVAKRRGMYIEDDAGGLKLNPQYGAADIAGEGKIPTGYDLFYKGKKVPGVILNNEDFNAFTKSQNAYGVNDPELFKATAKYRGVSVPESASSTEQGFSKAKKEEKPQGINEITPQQRAEDFGFQAQFPFTKAPKDTTNVVTSTQQDLEARVNQLPPEERKQFLERMGGKTVNQITGEVIQEDKPKVEITPTPAGYVKPEEELPETLKKHTATINRVSSEPLLKNETPLIKAIAAVESGGKKEAISPTGVKGLLQVTEATAKSIGKRTRGKAYDRAVPEENVEAGKALMTYLLNRFDNNLPLALAAYNGGEGIILEAARDLNTTDFSKIVPYLKWYSSQYPDVLSPKKAEEIAQYPGKVIEFLQAFAQDTDPVWTLI